MADISLGRTGGCLFSTTLKVAPDKRARHMHIIGSTGSGKTTLLGNMVLQDIRNGQGVALIDPKGDLVEELIGHIPPNRFNDVILFDISDSMYPCGFNALEPQKGVSTSRIASELVSAFKKLFGDSWGPRLENTLRYSVLTLSDVPGSTLLDIPEILQNDVFRQAVLSRTTDPVYLDFWNREFAALAKSRDSIMIIEPILNKVGPWMAYPEIRNVVDQVTSSFNLREVMDKRKILLARLPQSLGEDITGLVGALLVTKIQQAALSRDALPPEKRIPFYLYVDEFQNFFTSAFAKILTEARSYRLALIVANQYEEQLEEHLQNALLYNVAVKVQCERRERVNLVKYPAFYLEPQNVVITESENTVRELGEQFIPNPPLPPGNKGLAKMIRQASRESYGRPRDWVEQDIRRRRSKGPDASGSSSKYSN